jgi:hypothetical protein
MQQTLPSGVSPNAMKRIGKVLICFLSGLAFCQIAKAVNPDAPANPYAMIVQRNAFSLVTPLPKSELPRPITKITLTGTTSILGDCCALLKAQLPAIPPESPQELSLILSEGQQEKNIRVLEINEKAGTVKVDDYGTIVVLAFESPPSRPAATAFHAVAPLPPQMPQRRR